MALPMSTPPPTTATTGIVVSEKMSAVVPLRSAPSRLANLKKPLSGRCRREAGASDCSVPF